MHDTKLIRTLRSLDRKELAELSHFCKAGFLSVSENVESLLKVILSYKPGFESSKLKKEFIYRKLFRDEHYDDTRMRLLISDALKIVNQFIGMKMTLTKPYEFEMLQLEHFNAAENNEFTMKRFREFRKKLDDMPIHDEHYFYLSFRLEELKNNFHAKRLYNIFPGSHLLLHNGKNCRYAFLRLF